MAQKSSRKTLFSGEYNALYQLRRSQLTVAVLSLAVAFLLLNAAYTYVDLSASNLRMLMVAASVLAGVLAILSLATLIMTYRGKRR